MSNPFLGEIRMVAFQFAPRAWQSCNGQLLAINSNAALFSLLGTTYGGNGQTNFALPNLQGKVPISVGSNFVQGSTGGQTTHTLITAEMPNHSHIPVGGSPASLATASGNLPGKGTSASFYAPTPNVGMNPATVATAGGSQPHDNMPPYLVINFLIAVSGIFPSRN